MTGSGTHLGPVATIAVPVTDQLSLGIAAATLLLAALSSLRIQPRD